MWVKVPAIIKKLCKGILWDIPTKNKIIYITFDDGPEPGVTPLILAFLRKYNIKATFFCLGSSIEQYPDLAQQIKSEGHCIANHGYMHLNGYKTTCQTYIRNANLGAEVCESLLFRPPYGKISPCQYFKLRKKHKIVLWSIMSMDFSENMSPEQCAKNVISNLYPGAIIVFHDSVKASRNVLEALPTVVQYLRCEGYSFEVLH